MHLFGFYASNRHGSRHHYYNSEVPSNARRDEQEFGRVRRLVAQGLVQFGDPCVVRLPAIWVTMSSLGDAESSLGEAKSSLGDAENSLGDAKSSLGGA